MFGYAPQTDNRIIKRQMTDQEEELVVKSFKGNQKVMRILAPVPIMLFAVLVLLSNASSGELALTILYYLFIAITVILCVMVIAMSAWLNLEPG